MFHSDMQTEGTISDDVTDDHFLFIHFKQPNAMYGEGKLGPLVLKIEPK